MLIASGVPITAELLRAIYGTDWADWTPTISGGGAATYSASGRWRRIGERTVAFTVQFSILVAGTGSSNVMWTLPTSPSRARRWVFPGAQEGGNAKVGLYAVTFTGGSGTTVDRVRHNGATNLVGTDLAAGAIFTFSGVYEEA